MVSSPAVDSEITCIENLRLAVPFCACMCLGTSNCRRRPPGLHQPQDTEIHLQAIQKAKLYTGSRKEKLLVYPTDKASEVDNKFIQERRREKVFLFFF